MLAWLMNLAFGEGRKKRIVMSVVVLYFMAVLLNGCTGLTKTAGGGGGGTSGTPQGTTTLIVRGSSGTITHSLDLTLTVK
jgi:hypothetical protein